MCSCMVKFWKCPKTSMKNSGRCLANLVYDDRRTLVGMTMTIVALDCNVARSTLDISNVKKLRYFPPLAEDEWKISFFKELINIRDEKLDVAGFAQEDIKNMIEEICSF